MKQGFDYWTDFTQRSILFADILRKRGNTYLEHLEADHPSVLVFDHETVMDGKNLDRPVNYALVRIIDRRQGETTRKEATGERRTNPKHDRETGPDPSKRPILIIDPRAGHGPGIAGARLDSQVGVALNAGHTVYFLLFFTEPSPGQTIPDVLQAQIRFIEMVAELHPDAGKPAIIGNCQAGWAAALIAADRPDLAGPMVFNGSPLSYWGGVRGASSMRYRGGLLGGAWLASLASDVGDGKFDGAHLVAGFEALNLANTFWSKLYHLFSRVDTEEERFLNFEKWWGGFFLLNQEEIQFIVNNLFISNELEQGFLQLQEGSYVNLKNFTDPIVIFASEGDNITPPQQALSWIPKVYETVEEIKRCGQVIVYLLHETIGHLGIFVSAKITRKEHKEIINSMDALEYLSPGLYEMVIKEEPGGKSPADYLVEFQERDMDAIVSDIGSNAEDEGAFFSVSAISKFNDKLYRDTLSPWVRSMTSPAAAETLRQLHPLRVQRYALSDLNPFMTAFKPLGDMVRKNRRPVEKENFFAAAQTQISDWTVEWITSWQRFQNDILENAFFWVYGNPWMKTLFYEAEREAMSRRPTERRERSPFFQEIETELWDKAMRKGGFGHAIIRIVIAIAREKQVFDMGQYRAAEQCMRTHNRLKRIGAENIKRMVKEQSAIMEKDEDRALKTLVHLLPEEKDRKEALQVIEEIVKPNFGIGDREDGVLEKIRNILFPA
jgi:poly(3-hydroxyalkanoate) synthetase